MLQLRASEQISGAVEHISYWGPPPDEMDAIGVGIRNSQPDAACRCGMTFPSNPIIPPTIKEMRIVLMQIPIHLAGGDAIPKIGRVLEKLKAQPLRSLLAAGIPVAFGSDGPPNAYLNIMFASLDPNRPSEAITRKQAAIAYTLTSAYAELAEKDKGSLEPEKLADLAVRSQDIVTVDASAMERIMQKQKNTYH